MIMELQQPAPSGPFVRKSIALAGIAMRACNDDVPFVVCAPFASNRDDMVYFIITLCIFAAIVTFALLPPVLVLNILDREFAWKRSLARFVVARLNPNGYSGLIGSSARIGTFFTTRTQMIRLASIRLKALKSCRKKFLTGRANLFASLRWICAAIRSLLVQFLSALFTLTTKPIFFGRTQNKVVTSSRECFFAVSTALVSLRDCVSVGSARAGLALKGKFVLAGSVTLPVKILSGCWQNFPANGASDMPIWRRLVNRFEGVLTSIVGLTTRLAPAIHPIFHFFIGKEVLGCWRELLLASTAAFKGYGYGIIHDLNCLSFSALSSCCQGSKATTFSQREATPLLDNISTIPFFATQQKTAGEVS